MGLSLNDAVEMVRQLASLGVVEVEFHADGTLYRCRMAGRVPPTQSVHPIAQRIDRKVTEHELQAAADAEAKREFEATAYAATEGVKPRHWKG